MSLTPSNGKITRLRKKIIPDEPRSAKKEKNQSIKKVSEILKKREEERTSEENEFLFKSGELAKEAANRLEKREQLKQREKEFEDSDESLEEKCAQLAQAVSSAEYLVVYTGAGISTAARIPDYRGTSGIWTLLQQGKDIGEHDLTQAEPTYTHMALAELYKRGRLKHVVSQNCDGLHLRSGLPRNVLSEVHGNMYIEVCRNCRPSREYLRLFDVTEGTARFNHRTQRRCYRCESPLADSIVHFGERGNLPWPINWKGACRAAEKADVILCMGSSLKVLKRYPWLWCMDKPVKKRPKLYIVNLQWTPKDCHATVKIHGKCDAVMNRLMKFLQVQVPEYKRENDPIFIHATILCEDEKHTTTRQNLEPAPAPYPKEELILITVESDPKACCSGFQQQVSHNTDCVNYVDARHDVPIIMAPETFTAPPFSIMEAMFFNYLYTLFASYPAFHLPLHSPSPLPSSSSNIDEDDVPLIKKVKQEVWKCGFCAKHYDTDCCLFYRRYEAVFKDNTTVCLCCEDDSESEKEVKSEEEAKNEDNIEDKVKEGLKKVKNEDVEDKVKNEVKREESVMEEEVKDEVEDEEKCEKEPEKQKVSLNPGWYGRGYRKKIKKKR